MAEQFPCPNGTYNPDFGRSRQDQCKSCTQGHFCEKGTVQPAPCSIGKSGCKVGAYNVKVMFDASDPCIYLWLVGKSYIG